MSNGKSGGGGVLTPGALIGAAESDLKVRQRNAAMAELSRRNPMWPYAFHRAHVRAAKDARDLLERAIKSPAAGANSAKRNTRVIYQNTDALAQALARLRGEAQTG